MTKDTLKIKLSELKSQIHQQWRKLTEDDLSRLNGGMDELTTLLRKRYGYGQAQAQLEINQWLKELQSHVPDTRKQ